MIIDRVWIGSWISWILTLITTNNYDSLTKLHTPNITVTTGHLEVFSAFTSHRLVAVSNGRYSSYSGFPNSPPVSGNSLSLKWNSQLTELLVLTI
jgi:hypothetical protein